MTLTEYAELDGLALTGLIPKGDISAREVWQMAIKACDQLNPKLNFVVETFPESIRKLNQQAPAPGPFAGVSMLIKDVYDVCRRRQIGVRLPAHTGSR